MPSERTFFNKAIYKRALSRFWIIGAAYAVAPRVAVEHAADQDAGRAAPGSGVGTAAISRRV